MAELKEQWGRVLRYRARYADALSAAPTDLMSLTLIPEQRRREIGRWFDDCRDFGITCCVYLHHLRDWADKDALVPITKTEADSFINKHQALQVVADLCNGTKHAELDRKPRSPQAVSLAKSLNLRSEPDDESLLVARHRVAVGDRKLPLLAVIDDAVGLWRRQFEELGIGTTASSAS